MVDVLQNFTALLQKSGKYVLLAEKHLPRLLAILMFIFVAVDLEYNISLTVEDADILYIGGYDPTLPIISDFLVLCFAIGIIGHKNISNSKAISLYLLSLSLSRILTNTTNLLSSSTLYFIVAIVMITISLNMVVTGVFFYRGISRNRSTVMIGAMAMAIIYILVISLRLHYAEDVIMTLIDNLSYVVQLILYLVLLAALDTYGVFINTNVGRADTTVRELIGRTSATDKTVLSEKEVRTMINGFGNMVGWTKVNDGTPVTYEYSLIVSLGDSNSEILMQKWGDSNKVYFTIADSFIGSLVYANRFSAVRYVIESNSEESLPCIRFVNESGDFIRFRVMSDVDITALHEEVSNES